MEFKEYRLGDIIKEIIDYRGKTPKKLGGNWAKSGIKAISAKNIKTGKIVQPETIRFVDEKLYKKWMKQEVEKGTILITSEAPFGEIFYWDSEEKIVLSQRIFGLKIKQEYNSKFIYYYMSTKKFQDELRARATGSTVMGLRQPELLKCKIIIPDREAQDNMVEILNAVDKKIELNNQINNNLFNLIKNMYFKMQEDMTEFKNIKLKDIANISSGKRPKNKGVEYNIPLIGASGIMAYTEEYNSDNDILVIGRVGTLGVVQRYFDKIWLSDNTLTIKTVYSNVLENYLKYVDYQSLNRGSTQPLITQTDISNLDIKFNEKEFNKFEDEVIKLRKKIELNNKQNKILEQLRDTLLPKLMNGEIDLIKIEV